MSLHETMLSYILMSFAQKLKELRKERDLTQGEVAKAIDVHLTHVSGWETGRSKPSLDSVIALSKLFGVSIDYLVFDNVPREGFEAINDFELYREFRETENLDPEDKKLIRDVIHSVLFKLKVKDMMQESSDSENLQTKRTETKQTKAEAPTFRKVAGKR